MSDTQKNQNHHKIIIIGSGPAGFTAALYNARAELNPVIFEGMQPGGQLTITTEVENYPGFEKGIMGPELMDVMRNQAHRFGAKSFYKEITEVDFSERPFVLKSYDEIYTADAVIVATGASAKLLGIDSEKTYMGYGVSACATCDGFFYRKKQVAVVGGGDTACEEACYLAGLASHVYLIVRKPFLRASQIMQDKVFNTENITVLFEHETIGLFGDNGVEGAHLLKRRGQADESTLDIAIDGFFLAIGHKPNSDIFAKYLETDEIGYIVTTPGTPRTNVAGVFAAGDVADPHYRQAITAAGSGCQAAIEAERYLSSLKK